MNEAESYGVPIELAQVVAGQKYWRVKYVRHLSPEENKGLHHIFADAIDEQDRRVFGTQLRITVPPGRELGAVIDKPLSEPGTNFPMWWGDTYSIEVKSDLPSDRVTDLHTKHPDEGPGNTLGHHSFKIVFQRATAGEQPEPPPPTPDKPIQRYILFGPPSAPGTRTNFIIAQEYALKCSATCGFSPHEALNAVQVIIVGGTGVVSEGSEQRLRDAGCQVLRIAGDSYAAEAAFRELSC